MRNNNTSPIVYIGVLLVTLVILVAANMLKNQFSSEKPQEETQIQGEYALKAVYLKKEDGNSIFVNLTDEYLLAIPGPIQMKAGKASRLLQTRPMFSRQSRWK